jgi:thiamine-monophosphate kinase
MRVQGMAETLKEVGEFGLIRRIRKLLEKEGAEQSPDLTVGVGDDAAAFKPRPGYEILVTCDSVVEGRHYLPQFMTPRDVGRRAMVLNISDIGAMGGRPRYALVSLGLKKGTIVRDVEDTYRGFLDELNPFGATIIGGNITGIGNDVFIDITLIGEAREGRVLRRSGARPGDIILVTGCPGESNAGMQLLLNGLATADHPLVTAYLRPAHRAREGAAVAEIGHATSMIDTSDGFLGDLGHLCEESGVGAEIVQERFPASKTLQEAAAALKNDPHELFLGASDDYELIITCPKDYVETVRAAVAVTYAGAVTEVGRITEPGRGIRLLLADRSERDLSPKGWDHFR